MQTISLHNALSLHVHIPDIFAAIFLAITPSMDNMFTQAVNVVQPGRKTRSTAAPHAMYIQ